MSQEPRARRLLHVGPHKTGTTTVQSAFHRNRDALAERGVLYLGHRLQPTQAAKAVAGAYPPGPRREAGAAEWQVLMDEARTTRCRQVVLSSEFFCLADDAAARRIAADYGDGGDVRVVVTLRSLAKVLPSQWQQFVQTGSVRSLHEYAEEVLADAGPDSTHAFWRRHRHDRLVLRWAEVVGADQVTVIVSDSTDPAQLPREFARLVGVDEGVLVPATSTHNRSLTWEEAEGIRQFNRSFRALGEQRAAEGLPSQELPSNQRLRAWGRVKSRPADPGQHRIELPESTHDRVQEIAREMVARIQASGVEVVGPVEQLAERPRSSGWAPAEGLAVPPHVARVAERLRQAGSLSGA
jgi:hypothetical protein